MSADGKTKIVFFNDGKTPHPSPPPPFLAIMSPGVLLKPISLPLFDSTSSLL